MATPSAVRRPVPRAVTGLLAVVAVLVAAGALLLGTAGPADAHAYLEAGDPGDGTSLTHAPRELRLSFSEHVVLPATTLTLLDGHGRSVPVRHVRLVTDDPADTEAPSEVVADLPVLPRGSYRLSWSTLSSDDLHRTSGLLVFGVRTEVHAGGLREPRPVLVEAVADAEVLAGLALALGLPVVGWVLAGVAGRERALRPVRRLALVATSAATVAALVTPLREVLTGDGAGAVLAGTYAGRWSLRETGLVLLVLGCRPGPSRRRGVLLGAGALLAATGEALLGHAAAQAARDPLRVPVTVVHLLAALGWTGAVAGLAVALLLGPRGAGAVPGLRAALRRFALPAATAVAVAAVTGVYLAADVVVSLDAVLVTGYGRTLLVKLVLVGAVAALGLVNHRRLRGRRDLDLPRRTVATEAALAGLVVATTALLLASQPATEPQLVDAGPRPSTGAVSRQVQDLQESVGLRPNRPGASVVLVDVFDTRRPATGPVTAVTVRLGRSRLQAARALGDGHWSLPVDDLAAGPVPVRVRVEREGTRPVSASYRWVVGPATAPPAARVSRAPLVVPLRWAAGSLAASALLCLVIVRRRSVRARRQRAVGGTSRSAEVGQAATASRAGRSRSGDSSSATTG